MLKRIESLFGYRFDKSSVALCWLLMYAVSYILICGTTLQAFLGPILAFVMVYLVTTPQWYVIVPLTVLINNGLGTVVLGRLSFPIYASLLVLFRIVAFQFHTESYRERLVPKRRVFCVIAIILYVFHFVLIQKVDVNIEVTFFMTVGFFTAYAYTEKNRIDRDFFYINMALSIWLAALHCVFMGGVHYHDATSTVLVARIGVVGAGAGDPNFSGLMLLMGIAILLGTKSLNVILKILLFATMLAATVKTISTTAVVAICFLLIIYFLTTKKLHKGIAGLLVTLFVLCLSYQIYIGLPESSHVPEVDAYIEKTLIKYTQFLDGDFGQATTARSDLSEEYLKYFNSQGFFSLMLGGNAIPLEGKNVAAIAQRLVPHNSYVDILIRYGLIGAAVIILQIVKNVIKAYIALRKDDEERELFLLKVVLVFYSYTLSIYYGSFFAIWMVLLFLF